MKFELHCHSRYSKGGKIPWEGLASPAEIIKMAKKLGLNGLAITDHSTTKVWHQAKSEAKKHNIIFIPGLEISSKEGHVIGLGLSEPVQDGLSLDETLEKIKEQGGLSVAPHPFDIRNDGIKYGIKKVDAVEVFNALSLDRITNTFCRKQAEKFGKPMVAGSDAHSLEMLGFALNKINASDLDSVLREIKSGRVSLNTRYVPLKIFTDWVRQRLLRSYPDVLKYININYTQPKAWLARGLLKGFVFSKNRFWDILADLGLGVSAIYGSLKVLSYY